jgi:hypothetical protein
MPITIQAPEGVFSPQVEDKLASNLTDAILSINGASDNPLARRHLIIPVSQMPADMLYAAGKIAVSDHGKGSDVLHIHEEKSGRLMGSGKWMNARATLAPAYRLRVFPTEELL